MTDVQPGAAPAGASTPALDLADYREVTIERSGEVEGHLYRRGTRHTVDAATLAALRAEGLLPADPAEADPAA